jgi:hypothetical protein
MGRTLIRFGERLMDLGSAEKPPEKEKLNVGWRMILKWMLHE